MTDPTAQSEIDWLYSTQLFGIKLGLENVQRLLRELGLPKAGQKFIHVAGTNGKGSTCAFMHSILKAAGINAGLFTSPHLIHFGERIRDAERMITPTEIAAGVNRLREQVAGWDPHPTFFELTLALALEWFAQQDCPWVVLETGLGGRLDATNAITPEVSVITPIGWDHMDMLGDTLGKIAAEKAGIIKPGVPVVTMVQEPEAMEVIKRTAAERRAALTVIDEPWAGETGLAGPHQRWNAAMAVAALRAEGFDLDEAVIARGLRKVQWPARFQKVGGCIIDGAHNHDSARVLVQTWQEQFPEERAEIIFGAVAGKDTAAVMRELAPIAGSWRFTGFESPRALPPEKLGEIWDGLRMGEHPVTKHAGIADALRGMKPGARVLIAGSLYLAGEALALLEDKAAAFEKSAQ
ncbi:bifunctional folylpolyglutamate synthase/dihydrofolate synthase [Prosthecobacter vanneervenii]|uniref:Dihydrofolate synthase/folylpolyglutamate synthase n=1 Tax=Prosthecobacter vanneervenii TaxID=48466 RepID=A0A7W7YAV7_9BACT|nr:folylpolyglutamate synthase/dihydrofolate synthase family protein [Prosthecobacter vanneervenii]MBB5032821.1 dihydrofolate synthase/folylpolyglutamate synthase [Prosthecobacter vanneervenii]